MRVRKGLLGAVALAIMVLLVSSCAEEATPTTDFQPTPTPDFQATIDARAAGRKVGTPTPTPVPADERKTVLEFVLGHDLVEDSWDKFDADFDTWRERLTACDASALQTTLRTFAGNFAGIAEGANQLPRPIGVRGLADSLIDAAENEGNALRQIRDQWQPGDPIAFDGVDIAQSEALDAQKNVRDGLRDLQERIDSTFLQQLTTYTSEFGDLNSAWDTFHRSYDDLRAREAELSSVDTVQLLSQLITQSNNIVAQVRGLPTTEATSQVSDIVAQASLDEDLALRQLRGTFEKSEDQDVVTFTPLDPSLFDAYDAQLVESNARRRQAGQILTVLLAQTTEETSPENKSAVEEFVSQFELLVRSWDQFHKGYGDWRKTEGGCDRSAATKKLGDFTVQFAALGGNVRDLPRGTFLRPLGELLVEAAEMEEQALRTLRHTWRPFTPNVYLTLDQELGTVRKLRRQVATGIQDLMARYEISSQDVGG